MPYEYIQYLSNTAKHKVLSQKWMGDSIAVPKAEQISVT